MLVCISVVSGLENLNSLKYSNLAIIFPAPLLSSYQVADSLEKGTEHEDEYMISEKELLVNR